MATNLLCFSIFGINMYPLRKIKKISDHAWPDPYDMFLNKESMSKWQHDLAYSYVPPLDILPGKYVYQLPYGILQSSL
jgi:hypothetical protein